MPAKITFTGKEKDALCTVITAINLEMPKEAALLNSLYQKMRASIDKEKTVFHGVGVAKVLEMARAKFGDRFKTPNMITAQWTIKMQQAINQSGVSEETAKKAIENCDWTGDIFAQTFIYKMAELAVMGSKPRQGKLFTNKQPGPPAPSRKSGWLGQLDKE